MPGSRSTASARSPGYAVYDQPAPWIKGANGVLQGSAAEPPLITFLPH